MENYHIRKASTTTTAASTSATTSATLIAQNPFCSKSLEIFHEPKARMKTSTSLTKAIFANKLNPSSGSFSVTKEFESTSPKIELNQQQKHPEAVLNDVMKDFKLFFKNNSNKSKEMNFNNIDKINHSNKVSNANANNSNRNLNNFIMMSSFKNHQHQIANGSGTTASPNTTIDMLDPFQNFQKFYIKKMNDFGFRNFNHLQSTNSFFSSSSNDFTNKNSKINNKSYDFIDESILRPNKSTTNLSDISTNNIDEDIGQDLIINQNYNIESQLMFSQRKKSNTLLQKQTSSRPYSPTLLQCKCISI
jgi:hypothetical protein